MKLRYRAQALADIDAIDRFVDQFSPGGADNVLRAIYASIHLICEHPLAYPQTDDPDIRVHVVRRYRYKIFYATTDDAVEIIHVRHGARRKWQAD
ncbi:type II toxin-antitoxin system RelE/ParE family toxin [Tardiphaga sp.]|uniref:type II toxin-antitoxin system RelE/ParE family toxin n=1 Tax=Tardiphaga sp. TaxID=1926292 RepID=UPI0025FE61FE|nr:type II toxin-antitoxin system RelE/ParE family toxin [Tardiphaga sp.]